MSGMNSRRQENPMKYGHHKQPGRTAGDAALLTLGSGAPNAELRRSLHRRFTD